MKKANLAFHTIAKIEDGTTPNPTIEILKEIAKGLNISTNDLIKS